MSAWNREYGVAYDEKITLIPDNTYEKLRRELEMLPKKKWKNYRSFLLDKWGVRSKIRYVQSKDIFINYEKDHKNWSEIVSMSMMKAMEEDCGNKCIAVSRSSKAVEQIIKRVEENIGRPLTTTEVSEMHHEMMSHHEEASHTYNHIPLAERDSRDKRRYAVAT